MLGAALQKFQHTAAQRRLHVFPRPIFLVSECFNTQPRRGGCYLNATGLGQEQSFNTQPRRGGCTPSRVTVSATISVSTHSRAEAAALFLSKTVHICRVSTHSRAEAAANLVRGFCYFGICFNTQPRRGGCVPNYKR